MSQRIDPDLYIRLAAILRKLAQSLEEGELSADKATSSAVICRMASEQALEIAKIFTLPTSH